MFCLFNTRANVDACRTAIRSYNGNRSAKRKVLESNALAEMGMSEISGIAEFPDSMFRSGCEELEPRLAVFLGAESVEAVLVDLQRLNFRV